MTDTENTSHSLPQRRRRGILVVLLLMTIATLAAIVYFLDTPMTVALRHWVGIEDSPDAPAEIYFCPMHPQYRSDRPGVCPICNMNLVPLESPATDDEVTSQSTALTAAPLEFPAGTVRISPRKQQLIGVQYGEVEERSLSRTLRTVARLAYDETRITRVHSKVDGWIEEVAVDFTGQLVRRDQPLLRLYSPALLATQQELLIARKARAALADNPIPEIAANARSLYESTRHRLRLWDVTDAQVREIEEQGEPQRTLTLYSPVQGFVLERNAFQGQRITPETELYRIADLSTIWALADVYEYEVPMVRPGQSATVSLPYLPGRDFRGRVTYVYPDVDRSTRTLKVRVELSNPGFQLKPDMFANVDLKVEYGRQRVVPESAVLDSGNDQTVFVALEGGYFEPRRVRLGQRVEGLYIVLEGLQTGERVVTSANFLIDSESQLRSALGSMRQ